MNNTNYDKFERTLLRLQERHKEEATLNKRITKSLGKIKP